MKILKFSPITFTEFEMLHYVKLLQLEHVLPADRITAWNEETMPLHPHEQDFYCSYFYLNVLNESNKISTKLKR